jgi:hypothetical protein
MYKHSVLLEMKIVIETEESLSSEELEEMMHELDYEFSSDYGNVTTQLIEESSVTQTNRLVK